VRPAQHPNVVSRISPVLTIIQEERLAGVPDWPPLQIVVGFLHPPGHLGMSHQPVTGNSSAGDIDGRVRVEAKAGVETIIRFNVAPDCCDKTRHLLVCRPFDKLDIILGQGREAIAQVLGNFVRVLPEVWKMLNSLGMQQARKKYH
jgi:hypothetical protein